MNRFVRLFSLVKPLSLPAFARHILPRLPIYIAVVFALYSLALLSYSVVSWQQMKRNADAYILADSARRATSVTDLSAMLVAKAQVHADQAEINTYLLNRDLGMSMRYGLGASLQAIENRFHQRVTHDPPGQSLRIIYLSADGSVLVDTQPAAELPLLPAATVDKPGMHIDAMTGIIVTSIQVNHKGAHGGTVITLSSTDLLYRNLLSGVTRNDSHTDREILMTDKGIELVNRNEQPLPAGLMRALLQLPSGKVLPANSLNPFTPDETDFGKLDLANTLLIMMPVPDQPLYLLTLLSESRAYGHISPAVALFIAALVPFLLLGAAFRLDSMRIAAEKMKADIQASQQKRASAEQRNIELAAEIWRREMVEKALAASEERWGLAVNGANDGIWDWNLNLDQVHYSDRWKSMLGYLPEEVMNDLLEWESRVHPDDLQRVKTELAKHLEGKSEFYQSEYRMRCKDGSNIWILDRGQALFNSDGQPVRMCGSHSDITERRAAEAQVQEQTEQLNAIFELSPDGFVSFDSAHQVSYVNSAFLSMTNLDRAAVMGLDENAFSKLLAGLGAQEPYFRGIAALRRLPLPSGKRELIEIIGNGKRVLEIGLRIGAGQRVSQILYFHDVTSETEVDQMKSEFLSTAAHELRTPMASIYGYAEVLMLIDFSPEERKTYLGRIFRQAELMAAIINELLDLARIEARRGKDFKFERIDICSLVRETSSSYKPPDGREQPNLSLPCDPKWVRADRNKMRQAINNVLSNAYKYSPSGGGVEISLSQVKDTSDVDEVRIKVIDHGIGLSPEQRARVCERFFRADTSGKIPGTGLGMSIVKEIMELHNGYIEIDSHLGQGSQVSLCLPAAPFNLESLQSSA